MAHPFIEGTIIAIAQESPAQRNPVIFLNTETQLAGLGLAQNLPLSSTYPMAATEFTDTWTEVDLAGCLPYPAETKAVLVEGILVLTNRIDLDYQADLQISFRSPSFPNYLGFSYPKIGQVSGFPAGDCKRSSFSCWVPVENGKLMFKWWASNIGVGASPGETRYAVNLSLGGYLR